MPISMISLLGTLALSATVGSVRTATALGTKRITTDAIGRIAGRLALPQNEDVARAIRRAQLSALQYTLRTYKKYAAFEATDFERARSEIFFEVAEEVINELLGLCSTLKLDMDGGVIAVVEKSVRPVFSGNDSDEAQQIRRESENAVWGEFVEKIRGKLYHAYENIPETFKTCFMGEVSNFTAGWHAAFEEHITAELKRNEDFRTLFSASILSEIAEGQEQTHLLLKLVLERLDRAPAEAEAEEPIKPNNLPYHTIGSLFKGRESDLAEIERSFDAVPKNGAAFFVLYGLGGVGKTRIAIEYAWAHESKYEAILLVSAETPESLRRSLAGLADSGILNLNDRDNPKEEIRLSATLKWLGTNDGWLMIVDGLDSPDALAELEKLFGGVNRGHILATGRLDNYPIHYLSRHVGTLPAEKAISFLMERTRGRRIISKDDDVQAKALVSDLGELALALEQAAAYIAKRRITFSMYRAEWERTWEKLAHALDPTISKAKDPVAITWNTSIDKLTPNGLMLFARLSWLSSAPIPRSLLSVKAPDFTHEQLEDALDDISAYSLANKSSVTETFSIHKLVQEVTRKSVHQEDQPALISYTSGWVGHALRQLNAQDVLDWPRQDLLLPHAEVLAEHARSIQDGDFTGFLFLKLAQLYKERSRFSDAGSLFPRALASIWKQFGPMSFNYGEAISTYGGFLNSIGKYAEAEKAFEEALRNAVANFGPNDSRTNTARTNLAMAHRRMGRNNKAELLYRDAISSLRSAGHLDTGELEQALHNYATFLQTVNRIEDSEPIVNEVEKIILKRFGDQHPKYAGVLDNKSTIYEWKGLPELAEEAMRRALQIYLESCGEFHRDAARQMNNLTNLLLRNGKIGEASELSKRALAIKKQMYGTQNVNYATSLFTEASVLEAQKIMAGAVSHWEQGISIHVTESEVPMLRNFDLMNAVGNYVRLRLGQGDQVQKAEARLAELGISRDVFEAAVPPRFR